MIDIKGDILSLFKKLTHFITHYSIHPSFLDGLPFLRLFLLNIIKGHYNSRREHRKKPQSSHYHTQQTELKLLHTQLKKTNKYHWQFWFNIIIFAFSSTTADVSYVNVMASWMVNIPVQKKIPFFVNRHIYSGVHCWVLESNVKNCCLHICFCNDEFQYSAPSSNIWKIRISNFQLVKRFKNANKDWSQDMTH